MMASSTLPPMERGGDAYLVRARGGPLCGDVASSRTTGESAFQCDSCSEDDDDACDLDVVAEFITEWGCAVDGNAMREWAVVPTTEEGGGGGGGGDGALMVATESFLATPPSEREEGWSSCASTASVELIREQQDNDDVEDMSTPAQYAKEIKKLQAEANELSAKLVTLRAARDARGSCGKIDGAESHKWTGWHAKAEKQRRKLMLVECENRDLKMDLKVQKDKAKSLKRILMKRAAKAACPKWSLSICVDDDYAIFASMLAETESMVAKTDAVMQILRRKVPYPARTGSFRELREQHGDADVVRAVLVDSEEVPFSRAHVKRAMDAMLRTHEMDQFAQQRFNTSNNTIMSKAMFSIPTADRGVVYSRFRQTVWSFSNDAYSVFVSTMLMDPVTDTGEPRSGVASKMQEWRVVSKGNDDTTLHQTLAIVSFSEREDDAGVLYDPSMKQQWQRQVPSIIRHVDLGFTLTNRRIETLLIDQASAASSRLPQ
ncbi:hypothetical protein FI667_g3015, partial [Globisporangium splendens]